MTRCIYCEAESDEDGVVDAVGNYTCARCADAEAAALWYAHYGDEEDES